MRRIFNVVILISLFLLLFTLFVLLARNGNLQLLNPQGYIAQKQSQLLYGALILGMVIGIAVVGFAFFIAFTYREGNKKAKYSPDWESGKKLTLVWWSIPTVIVLFLAGITWETAHQLDPYKPINSLVKPITIQVVALRWKWLFIYPEQSIATVNFIEIPVNTPINFQLTADAPMNSFWIPSLGGQIYAMAGMVTQLHLMSSTKGNFPGSAAEISGQGFSGMNFTVRSTAQEAFNTWVQMIQKNGKPLDLSSYNTLAQPSSNNPPAFYFYADKNLYNEIIMKYMEPSGKMNMKNM